MKTMKKGVSVLLVFLLVLGMFAAMPMSVSAATDDSQAAGDKYGDFVYSADTDENGKSCVWITEYLGNDSKVTIPNTIKNMYVIGIDQEVFAYHESLRSISIPKTVKYIGYSAFSGCINLQEITLPKDLIYLDAGAFLGCMSLKTVTIPSAINFFGYGSFAMCGSLQEFKVTSGGDHVTAVNGVLYSGDKKILLSYPCGKPGSIFKVPASVEEIASNSFMGNLNIRRLIIQNKCKTIGDYAFSFSNMEEILVPDSVKEIGSNPFEEIQNVLVYCNEGSAMYRYCQANEINGGPFPVLVTSVKLNTNKISWPVGKSGSFKPAVSPSNAKNKALTWKSSNPKVATVDANGKLRAVGVGSATITCTAKDGNGAKATCAVTVYQPVKSVKLNTNKISWPVGKSGSFKPAVSPSNAKNKALTWKSSDPKVATVDANGKLKAVGVGNTTITCTAKDGSGAKATCAVTVYQPVKSVKLNTNKISWPVGKSGSFKPTVSPSNAKNKALTWKSSNPKVATVDANGKLKAVGVGSATITCTAKDGSGAKATCAVTVYQPVKSVKLNTNKISWPIGKSGSFKPAVSPSNAKNKALTWKSSNPKVATVDANGKLKAVGVGSTTITCTAKDGSGAKATCAVTVYQPVKSVKLNTNKISWPVGKSGSFKPAVSPSNAKNKALTWKSSNPKVATVDANGKLKAVGVGSTTITCTAKDGSGAKATCAVTVYQPVKSVKLNTNKISWPIGKSGSFKPTVSPSNAKNKALTWKSSNPKVATVDANGKLKAVGVGSATITCTAKDGSGAMATCAVTVYDPKVSVYKVGDKITYTAFLSGVNAPLCGINASIHYDGGKVRFNEGSLSFPYIGKPIYNTQEKNEIFFNTTNLDGIDFSKQQILVQATFTVTDASFTSKDISLEIREMLDYNVKDLKGTVKETVVKG